jgi:hypothetical protein
VKENDLSDLASLLSTGVGILVATRSEDLTPAITRGWGPLLDESTPRLEVSVTAPAGSATLSNLESTRPIAVTVSQPTTYRTMQMKGVVDAIGDLTDEQRSRVQSHQDLFHEEVAKLGVTANAANLFLGDLRVVSFVVDELFDQTPGVGAGNRLW